MEQPRRKFEDFTKEEREAAAKILLGPIQDHEQQEAGASTAINTVLEDTLSISVEKGKHPQQATNELARVLQDFIADYQNHRRFGTFLQELGMDRKTKAKLIEGEASILFRLGIVALALSRIATRFSAALELGDEEPCPGCGQVHTPEMAHD